MQIDSLTRADWLAFELTLWVAFYATGLALVLGVLAGWFFSRVSFYGKSLCEALLTIPLILPPTVLGYYLLVAFGQNSWLGHWLKEVLGISLVFTWQGAVVAASIVAFPLVFKAAKSAFDAVDTILEDAARTLGYRSYRVFFRVTLPLAFRGILGGTLLAFARSMGEFGATLMIAGNLPGRTQTLSMVIYDAVLAGDDARAHVLVVILTGVCIVILTIAGILFTPRYTKHSRSI